MGDRHFDPGGMLNVPDYQRAMDEANRHWAELSAKDEQIKNRDKRIMDLLTVIKILSKELKNG